MNSKTIEKRFNLIRMLAAVVLALGLALLMIAFISKEPLVAMKHFLLGPLDGMRKFWNVVELAIPLTFTGLAVSIIFSADMANMSGEGAFYMSCAIASWCAINLKLPPVLHILVCLLAGTITGMIITGIPAVLKVKWDANELVSSLMLNYICLYMANYIIRAKIGDTSLGITASKRFLPTASLPNIIPGSRIHLGIVFIGVLVIFGWFMLYRSRLGYRIRITGKNSEFAKSVGISVGTTIMASQLIGGGIAGFGGATEMLGMYNRFQYQGLPGYGFDGLIIAILARYNPAFVPIAAFFLAYLKTGASIMNRLSDVPLEIVSIIQAIVIVLVVATKFGDKIKHRAIVKSAQGELEKGATNIGENS